MNPQKGKSRKPRSVHRLHVQPALTKEVERMEAAVDRLLTELVRQVRAEKERNDD